MTLLTTILTISGLDPRTLDVLRWIALWLHGAFCGLAVGAYFLSLRRRGDAVTSDNNDTNDGDDHGTIHEQQEHADERAHRFGVCGEQCPHCERIARLDARAIERRRRRGDVD